MPFVLPFEEAYAKVIEHAAEGVDVDSVYRNLGLIRNLPTMQASSQSPS